jgi:hypothetical protein
VSAYITFARIQAVRSGAKPEMLIGLPSFLEIFPDLGSFGSSLLLKESLDSVDQYLSAKQEWRRWLLFLKTPNPDGTSIDAKLIRAPVAVSMDEKYLRTATSAFEKQQMVIVKVIDEYGELVKLKLSDIELIQEK